MRLVATVLGVLLSCGFTVIAGVMNWHYGLSLGRSGQDQLIFAAVSVGVDAAKILMPFFFWWAYSNARWIPAALSALVLAGCVTHSIVGVAGFVESNRATTTGTLIAKRETVEGLRADLKRTTMLRESIGGIEPVAVITQRLEVMRLDNRWRTSKQCAGATLATSRDYCADLGRLETLRLQSLAAAKREHEIAGLRLKITELAGPSEIDRGDPRAGIVARVTGWELLRVQTWLSLLLVGIVEFMSTFGIFISLNHGKVADVVRAHRQRHQSRGAKQSAAVVRKSQKQVTNSEAPRLLEAPHSALTLEHIAQFSVACLLPKEGAAVNVNALYPLFKTWCERNRLPAGTSKRFVEQFAELCERSGFPLRYEGDAAYAANLEAAGT